MRERGVRDRSKHNLIAAHSGFLWLSHDPGLVPVYPGFRRNREYCLEISITLLNGDLQKN